MRATLPQRGNQPLARSPLSLSGCRGLILTCVLPPPVRASYSQFIEAKWASHHPCSSEGQQDCAVLGNQRGTSDPPCAQDSPCSYPSSHVPVVQSPGSTQRDTPAFHPLRAAILEKIPLVERGGSQADEEAKESKETAQLSEAAPVPTEPQVKRPGAPWGKSMVQLPYPALTLLPSPPGLKALGSVRSPGWPFWGCPAPSPSGSHPRRRFDTPPQSSLCSPTPW